MTAKKKKKYIIDFPSTSDIDVILNMISLEMSAHQTPSDSYTHAATSIIISNNFRKDLLTTALKEKELCNNWKTPK